MYLPSGQGTKRRLRAQSGPLGLLLVFALVVAATTVIVALGAGAITGSQEQLDAERTEKAMTQLDSQAALVALGSSEVQRVDISVAGSEDYVVEDDAGHMTVAYENQTDGTETTVFSRDLGRIVYEGGDGSTIAYQGGGVWRSDGGNGSVMVSPPEFHYREATLTLPLVVVNSSGTIDDRAVISGTNTTQRFPNTTADPAFSNPLENARVEVTVTSEYYRAWGQYFETRTEGQVAYDDANERVTLALVTPLENTRVTSATASLSASGAFTINGASTDLCASNRGNYTDSYNSSGTSAGYCGQSPGNDGDLVYGGDVDIDSGTGGDDIRGDVVSGGSVYVSNSMGGGQPYVYGNISYTTNCDDCAGRISDPSGDVTQISGVDQASAINGIVRARVDDLQGDSDNPTTGNVSGQTLDYTNAGTSDTVELHAGEYYLQNVNVGTGDTVLLNTTAGDIVVGIEEDLDMASDSEIRVTGDGTANVYVQAGGGTNRHLEMAPGADITNSGDDAPQFRLFGPDNFTAVIGGGNSNYATYVGVIYAPPGTSGTGTVTIDGGVVYGGILTGTTTIPNGGRGSIHYDEALRDIRVIERGASVVRVTYIHASTNEVTVEDG